MFVSIRIPFLLPSPHLSLHNLPLIFLSLLPFHFSNVTSWSLIFPTNQLTLLPCSPLLILGCHWTPFLHHSKFIRGASGHLSRFLTRPHQIFIHQPTSGHLFHYLNRPDQISLHQHPTTLHLNLLWFLYRLLQFIQ
jgi:hypothetical protein